MVHTIFVLSVVILVAAALASRKEPRERRGWLAMFAGLLMLAAFVEFRPFLIADRASLTYPLLRMLSAANFSAAAALFARLALRQSRHADARNTTSV